MTAVPLNLSNSVKLDSSGNGTVRLGPTGANETWTVSVVHVKTNQAPASIVNEAQCFIYSGYTATDEYFADSTSSGSTGDSTDSAAAYPVTLNEWIWAVWKGGDAGAQGVVRITGTKDV
jgi:hypothetical protein